MTDQREQHEGIKAHSSSSSSSTLGALSSIAPAVASTACCWGPAVVSMFGATASTPLLSRISRYRPYLLGMSATMISYSFYRVYGPPAQKEHACCQTEARKEAHARQLQTNRAIVWCSLGVALAGATYGRVSIPTTLNNMGATPLGAAGVSATTTSLTKLSIPIEGMHCTGCANKVRNSIQKHLGTRNTIVVDHEKGIARVEGSGVDQKKVEDAIVEAGYAVR